MFAKGELISLRENAKHCFGGFRRCFVILPCFLRLWRKKMKKFFVLLGVLALFMLSFGSCESISDESAYNIGYSAGYLGAELSS